MFSVPQTNPTQFLLISEGDLPFPGQMTLAVFSNIISRLVLMSSAACYHPEMKPDCSEPHEMRMDFLVGINLVQGGTYLPTDK